MTAQITPLNTASPLTGTVTFSIGSHIYGTVAVVPVPGDVTGKVQATLIPQISELPNNYTVTATFASTNNNYASSSSTKPLTVTVRDVAPLSVDGFYTGTLFAWTTGPNTSTATVTLSATLKDNNTPTGDLRGAKVTFYLVNGTTLSPISSAQNLPVGLVDISDGSVGTASAIAQLNIGTANAASFQIAVGVTGAYKNNPFHILSQSIVTVSKPIVGGYMVGGGDIANTSSNGYIKGANKSHFQCDIQYNSSGTNPKGKVNIIVGSYNKVDGTLDNKLHSYSITTSAIALLNVGAPNATATFSAKANLNEILSDGTIVAIEGGATFQMVAFQNACDQKVAITLNRKAGGIWYSNNWTGTTTALQSIANGVVSVSGGGACSQTQPLVANNNNNLAIADQLKSRIEIENEDIALQPQVITNPTRTTDRLTLEVKDFNDGNATVRLYDLMQRLKGEWKINVLDHKGQVELDMSSQIEGVYIIVIDDATKKQRLTQKVLKINY